MNKKEICNILSKIDREYFSHVLICHNKTDDKYFVEYVEKSYDIDEYIGTLYKKYSNEDIEIEESYNLTLDLDMQLNEEKSNHREKIRRKEAEKYPEILSKSELALMFATKKHEGQKRKNKKSTEYISHPINVANIIKKYINSSDYEDYITVSYLHDTLEDTNTTFEELISIFGLKIAYLVKELTNDPDIKKDLGKTKYLSIKMKNMDDKALTIKLCDRLDNVSSLYDTDKSFKDKYVNETITIMNYLLNNRDLNDIHLKIIKDIINILNIIIKYSKDEININEMKELNFILTKKEAI